MSGHGSNIPNLTEEAKKIVMARLDTINRSAAARILGAYSASKAGKASAAKATPEQRKARASKGGHATAAKRTPAERSAAARRAATARWGKWLNPYRLICEVCGGQFGEIVVRNCDGKVGHQVCLEGEQAR